MSELAVVVIAPRGPMPAMAALVERLKINNVATTVVDELRAAAQLAAQSPDAPPCILVDLETAGTEIEDRKAAAETIRRVIAAVPHVQPIAIVGRTDAALFLACQRAGAGDVLDVQLEGTANATAIVQAVWERQRLAATTAGLADQLRAMIEDLLKDLIKTERRTLALEEKLAIAQRASSEPPVVGDTRSAAILIVEQDRQVADQLADELEDAGITTYLFGTGEHAVREATQLVTSGAGFDLALVAAQLPGWDGLETVRRLRELVAGLPAFLVTARDDAELAARAADFGVVGFVKKPIPDPTEVVARLAQLAGESLARTREHMYLERIKARHERVLARYRSLPRQT